MFNTIHNPTDFLVIARTKNGNHLALLVEKVKSDDELMNEITKIKKELEFTVITTYPVLVFDMRKPDGKGIRG